MWCQGWYLLQFSPNSRRDQSGWVVGRASGRWGWVVAVVPVGQCAISRMPCVRGKETKKAIRTRQSQRSRAEQQQEQEEEEEKTEVVDKSESSFWTWGERMDLLCSV